MSEAYMCGIWMPSMEKKGEKKGEKQRDRKSERERDRIRKNYSNLFN